MGALIQILEVGGELGIGVSAEMRKWSDADLKNSIGKRKKRLIRDGDGAPEEPSPARLLLAICSKEEGKAGVFGGAKGGRRQRRL